MSRKSSWLLAAFVTSFVPAQDSVPSSGPPAADVLLAALEKKLGPAEKRLGKGLIVRGGMSAAMMPGKGQVEEVFAADGRVKFAFTFPGMGASTWGTDGTMSWSTDPAMGITIRRGEAQAGVHHLFAILRQAPWGEQYAKAEVVGPKTVRQRATWELRMTPKAGQPEAWFIDQESGLLARADVALPNPTGGELKTQWSFADWKDVGGVLRPFTRRENVMGMELVYTVDSVQADVEIKPEQVAVPPAVAKAAADPQQQAPLAPDHGGECATEVLNRRPVASVRLTIKPTAVSATLADVLPDVMRYLQRIQTAPAGPPFARYHRVTADEIDLEAGIPVAQAVAGEGRIKASDLPAGKAGMTWHVGPYQELRQTHELLETWLKAQGLKARGGPWEIYWTDPGLEPDPKKWKTQLYWPVE